jgi:hypothetical protein
VRIFARLARWAGCGAPTIPMLIILTLTDHKRLVTGEAASLHKVQF